MLVKSITIETEPEKSEVFTVGEKWNDLKVTSILVEAEADGDKVTDISIGIYGCRPMPNNPFPDLEYWDQPDLIQIYWLTEEEGGEYDEE